MQYKSPIKIISPFIQKNEDVENMDLHQLKKRIFAEFELAGTSTLKTKYGEITKNDAIQLFNDKELQENLKYHLFISKFPALLSLLETNIPSGKLSFDNIYFLDGAFRNFLSPYLANSLGNFFALCIRNPRYPVHFASKVSFPVLIKHEQIIKNKVYEAVLELTNEIDKKRIKLHKTGRTQKVENYFSNHIINVLSQLPYYYLSKTVENFAIAGLKYIATYIDKKKKKLKSAYQLRFIINQLLKLSIPEATRNKVVTFNQYLNYMEQNARHNPITISFKILLIIGGIVLYLILMLIRFL